MLLLPPGTVRVCQKALRQMVNQSELEKDVASLSDMPLHADIVLHPQIDHPIHITVVIET